MTQSVLLVYVHNGGTQILSRRMTLACGNALR